MNYLAVHVEAPEEVGLCEENETFTVGARSSKQVSCDEKNQTNY